MHVQRAMLAAAVTLAASCGGQAVRLGEGGELPRSRWEGSMVSPAELDGAVEMQGTAWMAAGESPNQTQVVVELQNAAPGGLHPWEIREGRCGETSHPFGNASNFEALEIGRDGSAAVRATVDAPLPDTGQYSIVVLASATNRDLVVACGNLAPPVN
ncbi:MAG TPA: hypothetical protein VFQ22_10065 [Longimicrobiales bacterium]|nr:hypothetical protein [Longimicrobiales bacterium]